MANREFDDVQIDVEFTQASTRANLVSEENLAISLGKISKWYEALIPTGGSSGQFLGWNSDGTAKWVSNPNSDTKVRQSVLSTNTNHPLLMAYSDNTVTTSNVDNVSYRNNTIYANPSTGTVTATNFAGKINNHTVNIDVPADAVFTDTNTTYSLTQDSTDGHKITLTPSSGTAQTITIPDNNTDTKVNVKLATTTKAYLLGTSTTPTSSDTAVTSIADTGVYLGTTAGSLYATTFYGALSGNATTATTASKLSNTSKIGDTNKPVYFTANGVPTAISYTIDKSVPSDAVFTDTDTKVTSAANHYTPSTASGSDKTASASGATAAWSIDVVKGVTLNTDGKGHVTGISVTSGKIPANPVPANNVTGSAAWTTADRILVTNAASGNVIKQSSYTIATSVPANAVFTDTHVNVTLGTTTKAYLLGTSTTPTSSATAVTSIADTGVYLGTTAGSLYATTFYGALSGNATTATTATTASKLSNTSKIGDTNKPVYFNASGVPVAISYTIDKSVPSDAVFTDTDTKVTSAANHYTPSTASGSDKSASASGATAAWSIDVVKAVTLNTDGKGHVTGISVTSGKIPANPNTDTKVTSSANHYTPSTASGSDKTASASGATAAWSIDVVKGVTLNTDGKGHVTGISVTSGKIPANPNTDVNVTQTNTTGSANYRVLLSGNANDTTETTTARKSTNLHFNPNTGALTSLGFNRQDLTGKTVDINTYNLSAGNVHIMRFIEKTEGGAGNISNIPVTGKPFLLDVELIRWASTTDYITRQIFTNANNPANSYVRYCTNGTWGSWTTRVYTNTDTLVSQTFATANYKRPLLMSYYKVGEDAGTAQVAYRNDEIYCNPSNGRIVATGFYTGGWGTSPASTSSSLQATGLVLRAIKTYGDGHTLDYNRGVVKTYSGKSAISQTDFTSNGMLVSVDSGGLLIVGGGESATNLANLISDDFYPATGTATSLDVNGDTTTGTGYSHTALNGSTEELVLSSDNGIYFVAKCNTLSERRAIRLDTNLSFYPMSTNTGSIGSSTYQWNTIYGKTLYENGTSLASKYEALGHTHTLSIATDSGTNQLTLAANTKYKLTAGGSTYIFTTPTDTDTKVNVALGTTTKAYLLGTSTTPTSTATAVTSIADTGVYLGTTAGSLYATTFYGDLSGNVNHTKTNPTSSTIYGITFHTSPNSSGTKALRTNDGLRYASLEGLAGTLGYSILILGNDVAQDTAANKYGQLRLYGTGTSYIRLSMGSGANTLRFEHSSSTTGSNFSPGTTNIYDLGTSSLKWRNVYATTFSGDLSGNASTASAWQTARTLSLSGQLTGSVSVKGNENMTLNGYLNKSLIYDDTSDFASYSWHKFAEYTLATAYGDSSISFLVSKTWGDVATYSGILTAHIRTGTNKTYTSAQLKWQVANSDIDPNNFVLVYTNTANTSCKVELWYKQTAQNDGWVFTVLKSHSRTGLTDWTLYTANGHGSASYTTGTGSFKSQLATLKNAPGIYSVKGTQTEATASWTGKIDVSALYDGLTIAYYLPYAGVSSSTYVTLNLTLADGTTTGAINCYYHNASRITTHYSAGSTIILTYWSAGSISVSGTATTDNRWTHADYNTTNANQTITTTNADYRVLFSSNANDTTQSGTTRKATNFRFNPNTANLQIGVFNGSGDGKLTFGNNLNSYTHTIKTSSYKARSVELSLSDTDGIIGTDTLCYTGYELTSVDDTMTGTLNNIANLSNSVTFSGYLARFSYFTLLIAVGTDDTNRITVNICSLSGYQGFQLVWGAAPNTAGGTVNISSGLANITTSGGNITITLAKCTSYYTFSGTTVVKGTTPDLHILKVYGHSVRSNGYH